MKTCSHANFRSKAATDIELRFFMKKKQKQQMKMKSEIMFYLYSVPGVTFSSNFLHAVTFLHVLHLDVIKSQRLKLKVKTKISLCMAITLDNPWQSLYTQYYRTV